MLLRRTAVIVWVALLGAVLASGGCKRVLSLLRSEASSEPVVAPELTPPSDEDVREFVRGFMAAVEGKKLEAANAFVDSETTMLRAAEGLRLPKELIAGMRADALEQTRAGHGVAGAFIKTIEAGGSVRFLRKERDAAGVWARFRVIEPDASFDHVRLLLAAGGGDPKTKIVDLQRLTAAQTASETGRDVMLRTIPQDVLQQLGAGEQQRLARANAFIEMNKEILNKKGKRALAVYDRLDAETQKSEVALTWRIRAAALTGDPALNRLAIDAFLAAHPDSPSAAIYAIDAFAVGGDYERALQAIDRLSERAGPDPYFEVVRAGALLQLGRAGEARTGLVRCLVDEPDLKAAHESLLFVALAEKSFAEVTEIFRKLHLEFNVPLPDLRKSAQFAAYVASPQFADYEGLPRR